MSHLRLAAMAAFAVIATDADADAQEVMPRHTVAAIKEATVFLRTTSDVEPEGHTTSGSGFVIRIEGKTGYVVTNDHVISPPRGPENVPTPRDIHVHFRSGTRDEFEARASVVVSAPDRDLAVLKVSDVPNLPRPLELNAEAEPFETMAVYIFGFPFGNMLAMGKGNPPVNVARGQVSSLRRDDDNRLTSVLIDGALNPGNSGGPVVDAKGKLVGVSTATIRGANIGFAIAVPELLDVLKGGVEGVHLRLMTQNASAVTLACEAPLLDPLDRIRSARLLYATGSAKFSRTKQERVRDDQVGGAEALPPNRPAASEPVVVYGPMEGASRLSLTVAGQKAAGAFSVPGAGRDVEIWCQVAYVDGSGTTVHSRPVRHLLGKGSPPEKGARGSGGLTVWGEVVDPDEDCELTWDHGALVGNVPGTLHDLNIDIGKNNAPRVVQEVDGDFVMTVKVAGRFQPGPVRTGPKSVPYNGGGLVVWLDQNNYLRLERAAMYRNNRVVGFLVFESRENGTRAQVHNKGGLDPGRDLWLRVERRGHVVTGAFREDGQDWEELQPMDVEWPRRLQAGVDIVNSCGDPMTVRFQGYSLSRTAERPGGDGR